MVACAGVFVLVGEPVLKVVDVATAALHEGLMRCRRERSDARHFAMILSACTNTGSENVVVVQASQL